MNKIKNAIQKTLSRWQARVLFFLAVIGSVFALYYYTSLEIFSFSSIFLIIFSILIESLRKEGKWYNSALIPTHSFF